jgi:hypothetical protein
METARTGMFSQRGRQHGDESWWMSLERLALGRVDGGCGDVRARLHRYNPRHRGWANMESAGTVRYARRFHPWLFILTEIYLCHTCSCHEILRVETPGQARGLAERVRGRG